MNNQPPKIFSSSMEIDIQLGTETWMTMRKILTNPYELAQQFIANEVLILLYESSSGTFLWRISVGNIFICDAKQPNCIGSLTPCMWQSHHRERNIVRNFKSFTRWFTHFKQICVHTNCTDNPIDVIINKVDKRLHVHSIVLSARAQLNEIDSDHDHSTNFIKTLFRVVLSLAQIVHHLRLFLFHFFSLCYRMLAEYGSPSVRLSVCPRA